MFDGKMFDDWKIRMKVVFNFQEVTKVIENGLVELAARQ